MNNNKLDCAIVRDLLSLYHDDVVSDTTKEAVQSHLEVCEPCREEYDSLCSALPIEESRPATGKSFANMMRRQKAKKIFSVIAAVLVSCAVIIGGYFAQLTVPCVSFADDVDVLMTHRVQTEDGEQFFFIIDRPIYDGALHYTFGTQTDEDGTCLVLDFRKSLLCLRFDGHLTETLAYDVNYDAGFAGAADAEDITEIRIGDRVIWSEEENGDDPVPEYVYDYCENNGNILTTWDENYNEENPEQSSVSAGYEDGRNVIWDFQGNVISDSME